MKTALDVDLAQLDAAEKSFIENVRKHGWCATYVAEDSEGPGFSYTTGFWQRFGAPEIVIFSLPAEIAHQILWNLYNSLEKGERFANDIPISEILYGFDVIFKPVKASRYADFLGRNRWFYGGDEFQAQQLFFPDKSGHFPWEASVKSDFFHSQPDLSKSDGQS